MKHQRQETSYWCGNACLAMLLNKSQSEMAKLVKTTRKGTHTYKVLDYLRKAGIEHYYTAFQERPTYKELWWLENFSKKHAVYLSCEIHDRFNTRGRDQVRYHAVLAADGLFYDPSNFQPQPFDTYVSTFNKELYLRGMIVFGEERKGYIQHEED